MNLIIHWHVDIGGEPTSRASSTYHLIDIPVIINVGIITNAIVSPKYLYIKHYKIEIKQFYKLPIVFIEVMKCSNSNICSNIKQKAAD